MDGSSPRVVSGETLYHQAEKCLSKRFSGLSKFEDAADYFYRAAGSYRLTKQFNEAGVSFQRGAECHLKLKNLYEAAVQFEKAADCFVKDKTSSDDVLSCRQKAIDIFVETGRYAAAGKVHKTVAQYYEGLERFSEAIEHFKCAIDYLLSEDQLSPCIQCDRSVGRLLAMQDEFLEASKSFEDAAQLALDSQKRLMMYGVNEDFAISGLCKLAVLDSWNARRSINSFADLYPAFANSREYLLLDRVCTSLEEDDVDKFMKAIREYDKVSRLCNVKTYVLLKIKKRLVEVETLPEMMSILGTDGGTTDENNRHEIASSSRSILGESDEGAL